MSAPARQTDPDRPGGQVGEDGQGTVGGAARLAVSNGFRQTLSCVPKGP